MSLDIGELPTVATDTTDAEDDPERIVRLTARLVARVADRFTILRKFSRHMEGTDRRAGLLSDAFATLYALYQRNPDAFEHIGKAYAQEFANQQRRRKAQSTPSSNNNQSQEATYATP